MSAAASDVLLALCAGLQSRCRLLLQARYGLAALSNHPSRQVKQVVLKGRLAPALRARQEQTPRQACPGGTAVMEARGTSGNKYGTQLELHRTHVVAWFDLRCRSP